MLGSGEIIGHIDNLYEKYKLQIKKLVDEDTKENESIRIKLEKRRLQF